MINLQSLLLVCDLKRETDNADDTLDDNLRFESLEDKEKEKSLQICGERWQISFELLFDMKKFAFGFLNDKVDSDFHEWKSVQSLKNIDAVCRQTVKEPNF